MTIRFQLDGKPVTATQGQTVLEAAAANGVELPTLCHHPDLQPTGSCRLCVVEVEGWHGEWAACTLEVSDGMSIRSATARIDRARKTTLELLLSDYYDDGELTHETNEFARWVHHYDARPRGAIDAGQRHPRDSDPHPFIRVDLNQCILCTRCVRACADVQGRFVWGVGAWGTATQLIAGADTSMLNARCESCGACVDYCPTGALTDRLAENLKQADACVTTTCPYCGVGCNFDLNVRNDRIIGVTANPDAPVNGMHLCVKGRFGYGFVHHPERLERPRVRRYLLESGTRRTQDTRGDWVETDWDTALAIVAQKLVATKRAYGSDAIGLLASAKCTNEENFLIQKFARQVLGTHNVDHCARLCHASTVAGLAMSFGSGAMSNTMRDLAEQAEAVFVIGSNPTEQHPVFGSMLRQSVRQRGMKLVVADPRAIDITEFAALHLRHAPGTDIALLNGLMHVILEREWHDERFIAERTEDFDTFRESLAAYQPERVAGTTGVPVDQLLEAAELLACHKPMAVVWAMGITQHTTGVMNVLSLANLQMLLGNLGIPGGGVNPLRGQNNVQGACDMGALANVFPGYQRVDDQAAQKKFSDAWALEPADGVTERLFGELPGLTVTEMIDRAGSGALKALYVLGENPAMTDPDLNHVRRCLTAAEFVVLQEIFPSETSKYADVLLPASAWAEKSGTFTNTERRIQLVRPAVKPPGEARQDWRILADLANRVLETEGHKPSGPNADWTYGSAAAIQCEIANLTPSYSGVTHARLQRGDALHWPVPDESHPGTPILHVDSFTRGKGRFHACEHLDPQELPDSTYPLLLTTGRVLYHWHGGEMTRRVDGLVDICPEGLVEVNPEDARAYGLTDGCRVRVRSRRGDLVARAEVTARVGSGVVFGNFHFPGEQNVNNLTNSALDPTAKIPEYKVCAVCIEPISDV